MLPVEKYDLAILIVIYNKELDDSLSYKSLNEALKRLQGAFHNIQLCVWNNGPKKINTNIKSDFYSGITFETLSNESLSVIYNSFIGKCNSHKYLILDHDSEISDEYLKECISESFDYTIPTIMTAEGIQSPKTYDIRSYTGCSTLLGIGSGICISDTASKLLIKNFNNVFDERFYLYGVDSTFFLRLNKLGLSDRVVVSNNVVKHSLSRLENESLSVKLFREKERSYDQALTLRYYFNQFTAITVLKKIIGCLFLRKSDINLRLFFTALISGKHYKNMKP